MANIRIGYHKDYATGVPNGAATVKTQIEAAKEVGISRRTDDEPPTLRQAVRLTAKLGGFLGRKCDGNLEQRPFGLAFSDSTTSQACISSWLPLSSHIPKTHPCPATQVVGKDQAHDGRTHGSVPYRFLT